MSSHPSLLLDVRRNTFYLAIGCIYAFTILIFLTTNTIAISLPSEQIVLSIMLISLCGLGLWLGQTYFMVATNGLLIGLWFCVIYAIHNLEHASLPYLFALLVLLASNLTYVSLQVVLSLSSTAFLVLTDSHGLDVTGPVMSIWITQVFSYVVSRGLVQALETSQHYQRYAVEQMEKARQQRFEMAVMTEALQASEESLRQLNIQLRYARDSAEEARRIKAQFAANVSHELRTPINLIVGFSEMVATAPEAYGESLPPVFRADIQAIYRNARHLQSMINDILDMSQIEAAQLAIIKEETDPCEVIDEAVQIATSLIKNKRLAFQLNMPPSVPYIQMDRTRIRQVIVNLLVNAVRFTETGAINLDVKLDERDLVIQVRDTGIGIPPDQLAQVFEEFYQIDGNFARKKGGTGLGLALSRQFVTLHNGRMWAESDGIPGKGSTFTFTLPLTNPTRTETQSLHHVSDTAEFVRQLIVWDDDPAIIQLFRGYTRQHRVLGTTTVQDVEEWLKHVRPVAILTDTKTDTTRLEREITANSPGTTLIKCPMPSSRRALQAIGLADYLVKPVSRETILEALDKLGEGIHDVILVDDERDMLRMLSRFLLSTHRQFDIRMAASGADGLSLIRHKPPDVVILDIHLPDVDGFSIIEHMKADTDLRDIPVIVVSGYGADSTLRPLATGEITMIKQTGFQPIELVKCVESLASQLIIPTGPEFLGALPDPAAS